jgi:urease accessory protein
MKRFASLAVGAALFAATSSALAHPGHVPSGFTGGIVHPFTGLDHLLAMVAVGLWAAQMSRGRQTRLLWLLPATFMAALVAGACVAFLAVPWPLVEPAISTSVLALGLLIALAARLPVPFSLAVTALFGLAHGYAHGSELPLSASPLLYASGFLLATATLHLLGVALGLGARGRAARVIPLIGVLIAAAGAGMLTGL